MSKGTMQRKSNIKKFLERDSSTVLRFNDEHDALPRKQCYQLVPRDKQRRPMPMNNIRDEQLEILRELFFNRRDIFNLRKKSNKSDKITSRNNITRDGTNNLLRTTKSTSTNTLQSSDTLDLNQFEEDNHLSQQYDDNDDEQLQLVEPVQLNRSSRRNYQDNSMVRTSNHCSQTRPQAMGARTINTVSFLSDRSKDDTKCNINESHLNASPDKLKRLLNRLSSELNDLESITGFESDSNALVPSDTCSTILATALISLTGHFKQFTSTVQHNREINQLKDQLAIVIKNQIDFQKKIENQMITLQTMMQTVCQLINNELMSNKKLDDRLALKKSRRSQSNLDIDESRQAWVKNNQRSSYSVPKDTSDAMNELLTLTNRLNHGGKTTDTDIRNRFAVDPSNDRQSVFMENFDPSKKLTRSTSSLSTTDINTNDLIPKSISLPSKQADTELRSSLISPIDTSVSYQMFESSLPNVNSSDSRCRNDANGSCATSTSAPISASVSETILEKILRERLRLVQQMAELNKQHEMTQEELANLETKASPSQTT